MRILNLISLGVRLAGAERGLRVLQGIHNNLHCEGMRTAEHTPGDPFRVLNRRHCLADIVERGVGVQVERIRVKRP